jgi:A/G-specific adenine glycosylase
MEPFAALRPWYDRHGRHDLPWRLTRDPYAVLVSEIMLQQTQVDRVLPYYGGWLGRWPTAQALAGEDLGDIIRAWSGLGYNRRAVNLHRAAAVVVAEHGGAVPTDPAALRTLPGIGAYTANAVASFAGEIPVTVIDTNVGRVIARAAIAAADAKAAPARAVEEAAASALPADGVEARHHNLALMDLGAMVCVARSPLCGICPLVATCGWRLAGTPTAPVRSAAPVVPFEQTARFARGRIVEALRLVPTLTAADLASVFDDPRHAAAVPTYLAALARDGLVEESPEGWRLAGFQSGNRSMASPNE